MSTSLDILCPVWLVLLLCTKTVSNITIVYLINLLKLHKSSDTVETRKTPRTVFSSCSCLVPGTIWLNSGIKAHYSVLTASGMTFSVMLKTMSWHQKCDYWMLFYLNVIMDNDIYKIKSVCYHLCATRTFGNKWADESGQHVQFDCFT